MKKVIVTGGLGFIGSNLIKILIKKKYFVINLDKVSYSSNFYNVKMISKNKNYKFIKVDINHLINYIPKYFLTLDSIDFLKVLFSFNNNLKFSLPCATFSFS